MCLTSVKTWLVDGHIQPDSEYKRRSAVRDGAAFPRHIPDDGWLSPHTAAAGLFVVVFISPSSQQDVLSNRSESTD